MTSILLVGIAAAACATLLMGYVMMSLANAAIQDCDRAYEKLTLANEKLLHVHETFYGQGYEILGWNMNGNPEDVDNILETIDIEPVL